MKSLFRYSLVAAASATLVALLLITPPNALSQDDDTPDLTAKQPAPQEMQKQMERWQASMQPSKWHRLFDRMLGEWETTTKIFMAGPNGPAMESTGTASVRWRVKGKWLESSTEGTMMGMKTLGFGVMGYDNFKQKYVASYHDNLGTNLLRYEGTLNQDATELMMWGSMDEPMTGQSDKTVGYRYKFVNPDTMILEIHDLHIGGDNTRVIEITHSRKK